MRLESGGSTWKVSLVYHVQTDQSGLLLAAQGFILARGVVLMVHQPPRS